MSVAVILLGVIACAAAGGVTSFLILERREARYAAGAKAEELYTLVEAFDQGLAIYLSELCNATEGAPAAGAWAGLSRDSARARMLVSFYFPRLWPQVRRADACVDAALDIVRSCQAVEIDAEAARRLEQAFADLRETMEALKRAIVAAHRETAPPALRSRFAGAALPSLRPAV